MLLKRHRIPRREDLHGDRAYWHWTDLRIGSQVDFYSKKYHICSCDDFTRDYLESEGISLDDSQVLTPLVIDNATYRVTPIFFILDLTASNKS